jgi:hypothetical protein
MARRPHALLSAAILAGSLLLAGCSTGIGAAGPQDGSGGGGGGAGSVSDGSKVCSLASVADAQGAMKTDPELTDQIEGEVDKGGFDCGYASNDQSILVNVIVYPDASDFGLGAGVMSAEALSPLSGVGEKAAMGDFELDAVVGGKGLVVMSLGPTDLTRDQIVALATLVASRLGR